MEIYVAQFLVGLMMFIRVTAVLVTAPLLSHESVPVQLKAGLGVFITYLLFPVVAHQTPALDVKLIALVLIGMKESLVGIVIGFSLSLLFAGMRYAGELMSTSIGLSITTILDPESGQSTPVIGEFIYLTTLLLFLILNGHHFVLEALQLTFRVIPIGGVTLSESLMNILIRLSGLMFVVAIKIAAPVLVAGFLINVGLSILARVMPQANIFMLSFPISISVGLLVILSSAPFLVLVFKKLLAEYEMNILELVRAM
jgi:flagellar biosynthetic protein FliR